MDGIEEREQKNMEMGRLKDELEKTRNGHKQDILSGFNLLEYNQYKAGRGDIQYDLGQICYVTESVRNTLVVCLEKEGMNVAYNEKTSDIIDKSRGKIIGMKRWRSFKDMNTMRNKILHLQNHDYTLNDIKNITNKACEGLDNLGN